MAAWLGIDDFNSYSDGDLNGNNGGSGWGAAWANETSGANMDVQGTTVFEGAKAVSNATDATSTILRNLSSDLDQTSDVWVSMRLSATNIQAGVLFRRPDGNACFGGPYFNSSGNVVLDHQFGTRTILTGYSADTWYTFKITIKAGGTYLVSVELYTGSFGGTGTLVGSTTDATWNNPTTQPNVHTMVLTRDNTPNSGTVYWDNIDNVSPFVSGPATVKTWDAVAFGSVKTLNGVAPTSLKTVDGLA